MRPRMRSVNEGHCVGFDATQVAPAMHLILRFLSLFRFSSALSFLKFEATSSIVAPIPVPQFELFARALSSIPEVRKFRH